MTAAAHGRWRATRLSEYPPCNRSRSARSAAASASAGSRKKRKQRRHTCLFEQIRGRVVLAPRRAARGPAAAASSIELRTVAPAEEPPSMSAATPRQSPWITLLCLMSVGKTRAQESLCEQSATMATSSPDNIFAIYRAQTADVLLPQTLQQLLTRSPRASSAAASAFSASPLSLSARGPSFPRIQPSESSRICCFHACFNLPTPQSSSSARRSRWNLAIQATNWSAVRSVPLCRSLVTVEDGVDTGRQLLHATAGYADWSELEYASGTSVTHRASSVKQEIAPCCTVAEDASAPADSSLMSLGLVGRMGRPKLLAEDTWWRRTKDEVLP